MICVGGGLALVAIASIVQSLSFGFANLSWFSLGAPFMLGAGGSYAALYLVRKKLLELGRKLDHEFKQRTRELKNSADRFQLYAEVSSDWFWETDAQHRFTFFSSHLFEVTGAKPEQLLGKTREDFRIESNDTLENQRWDTHLRCLEQHLPFTDFDYRGRLPNGGEIVVRASGKPYFGSEGEFLGYRGSTFDVSEAFEDRQSLQRAHELIYTATALLNNGFILFDVDGRMMMCNDRYRQFYAEIEDKLEPGVTFAELARAYADTMRFDTVDAKNKWIEKRIDQYRNPLAAFDQKLKNGTWVRIIDQKLPGGGTVGLRVDITESKKIEEELENAQRIAHVGSWRWDIVNDRLISCSQEYANIFGVPLDRIGTYLEHELEQALHPDDREHAINFLQHPDQQM